MKNFATTSFVLASCVFLSGCASIVDTAPERLTISGYSVDANMETVADIYHEFAVLGTIVEISPETYFVIENGNDSVNGSAVYFTPVRISITKGTTDAPVGDLWVAVHSDLTPSFDIASINLGDTVVVASELKAYDRGTGQPMHVIQFFGEVSPDGLTIGGLHETDAKDMDLQHVLNVFNLS